MLGLSDDKGCLVIVGVALGWVDESDDAIVTQAAQELIADIDEQAKNLGEYNDFKYLNYAENWQDPIGGYGAENVATLRKVSKAYDPKGIFQKNVPGGFKLF
jgi:hypothetical protein